jgi:hypothetical protein
MWDQSTVILTEVFVFFFSSFWKVQSNVINFRQQWSSCIRHDLTSPAEILKPWVLISAGGMLICVLCSVLFCPLCSNTLCARLIPSPRVLPIAYTATKQKSGEGSTVGFTAFTNKQTNSVALSPQASYIDWTTATCRRNLVPTFVDKWVSRGQRGGYPTVVKQHLQTYLIFCGNWSTGCSVE